jgi:putative aldouronate transport system substrate-binding protein
MLKKKARHNSLLAVVLCFTFVLAACNSGNNETSNSQSPSESASASASETASSSASESASAAPEPITLTVSWDQQFNGTPGVQSNRVADAIKAKTGVTMDIMSMDPDKIKVMLAEIGRASCRERV